VHKKHGWNFGAYSLKINSGHFICSSNAIIAIIQVAFMALFSKACKGIASTPFGRISACATAKIFSPPLSASLPLSLSRQHAYNRV